MHLTPAQILWNSNHPPVPPPPFFQVTVSPSTARVSRSPDFIHWQDTGTNFVVVTNNGTSEGFRAVCNPRALVTWTPSSTNAIGFTLILTSQSFPPGAYLTVPLPATNSANVCLYAGTNTFYLNEIDQLGDTAAISPFPPPAAVPVTNPVISIMATNQP